MHGDQLAVFILLVLLITAVASMAHTVVKGRQRLAEIRASAAARAEADPHVERLTDENGRLQGHIAKWKDAWRRWSGSSPTRPSEPPAKSKPCAEPK